MDRIEIPAREGRAWRLGAGDRFRVIDVEGRQVGDLWAFAQADVGEYHSASHTRVECGRVFPRPGEHFWSNRRRRILTLIEDRSPGIHDMLMAACDPERYARLGADASHASCQDNLERAMAAEGHPGIVVPQPINLFMNTPVDAAGDIEQGAPSTAPGDSVTLRCELDAILVLSACPQDIVRTNAGDPTSLAVELLCTSREAV
jgi:uncharacterized protein YcgI (DUF1989 family)